MYWRVKYQMRTAFGYSEVRTMIVEAPSLESAMGAVIEWEANSEPTNGTVEFMSVGPVKLNLLSEKEVWRLTK